MVYFPPTPLFKTIDDAEPPIGYVPERSTVMLLEMQENGSLVKVISDGLIGWCSFRCLEEL